MSFTSASGHKTGDEMTVTDDDLADLIVALDKGRARWISGQGDVGDDDAAYRQADDMTIFGPFGGPGPTPGAVTREQLRAGQAEISAQFHGGDGTCELVRTIVEGDLVIVVLIERSRVRLKAFASPQPWVLRTTQVFRKTDDGWVRLHRHADPLITPRSLVGTVALVNGV
jgi:ketosteroid isomerase-like protein